MSNSLAIAATTATLRNLLTQGLTNELPGTDITTMPPDKARVGKENKNQVNLFLYQTRPNAAWRNVDMPRQVKVGETGQPPLALSLHYLITAYGQQDEDALSHQLLGRAMNILHDHPVLGREEIQAALPDNDLYEQVDRVRIIPEAMSLDELSKLWTTFQTEYRISAAYQASVVLIESTRLTRAPLPVLTRGPGDEGAIVQLNLVPPIPTLESVVPPNQQPSARLGDTLTVLGHDLQGDGVVMIFSNPRLSAAIELAPLAASSTQIEVEVLDAPADWVAGFYTLAARITRSGEPDRTTNQLSFSLAPRILDVLPDPAIPDSEGDVTLTVTCSPEVRPDQRAALLLADREVLAGLHPSQTDELEFEVTDAPLGDQWVRLRVDGVDSLLVDRSVTPPIFDPTQKVTISAP